MLVEALALIFKFDAHALPSSGRNLPQGLAVREPRLYRFDRVAQIFRQHPEQQHHALLVHWLMAKPAEVTGIATDRSIL